MLDADGSADPREIPRFVDALVDGADFAKGTRFARAAAAPTSPAARLGNRWLNRTVNMLFGTRYTDLCYGYNAFWAHCLPFIDARRRRLRDRDAHQHPRRQGRAAIVEVPSFEFERIHGAEQPQHLA